jgi:hypothetical protein
MTILFIALAAAMLVGEVSRVHGQADILAVTSFRDCVQLDPTVQGKAVLGQQLDCSALTGESDPPPVTTLDLQITPGLTDGSTFDIDLSVVLNDEGGSSTTSQSPTQCTPTDPQTQLCRATQTAKMRIKTSKPVFAYDLDRFTSFEIPYCYASLVQFEQFQDSQLRSDSTATGRDRLGTAQFGCQSTAQYTASCGITSASPVAPSDAALTCMINQNTALKSMLYRMQQPYPKIDDSMPQNQFATYLPGRSKNFDGTDERIILDMGFGFGDVPISYPNNRLAECDFNDCQGNIYFPKISTEGDPDTACCDKSVTDFDTQGYCENRNNDIRVPALRPMPSAFGFGPVNLANAQSDDTALFTRNVSTTAKKVWKGETEEMTFVGCASPSCAANKDARRVIGTNENEAAKQFVESSSYQISRHLILPIEPGCSVYRVDVDARVIIDVEIEVTVQVPGANPGDPPVEKSETLSLNNFNVGESSSSLAKLIRARFENIESVNSLVGPSISGYVVVCGRDGADDNPGYIDMRELISGKRGVPVSEVPLTENPWPTIIETWNENAEVDSNTPPRTHFFPHPFDYVQPGVGRGKAGGSGLQDDFGQSFWYFVPDDVASKEWGTGCNQVGVKASFSSSVSNQDAMCRLPPHECVPGIGKFYAGGRKTSVPCTVSSMFMFTSGMQSEAQQQFIAEGSRFNFTLDQAKRFMPNDEFSTADPSSATLSSAPLYDSEQPNFWLSGPAPRLMYQPSGSQTLASTVTAELVVDFVGSFVQYEDEIALAKLVFPAGENGTVGCKTVQDTGNETIAVSVENLSQPGAGVASSYRVSLVCNETQSGLSVVAPVSGAFLVNDLPPGATSDELTFVVAQSGVNAQSGTCVMTLASATDVVLAPIMQIADIDCSIQLQAISPFPSGANGTAVLPMGDISCSQCDLSCKARNGGIWGDPCFLTIVIVSLCILGAVAATPIMFLIFWTRNRARTLDYTNRAAREVDERVENIKERAERSPDRDRRRTTLDRDTLDDETSVDAAEDD